MNILWEDGRMETQLNDELYYYVQSPDGSYTGLQPVDLRPKKKARMNPIGENIYLLPDETLKRDEDLIVKCQRIWLHNAYKPGGKMYQKILTFASSRRDQNASHTTSAAPSSS